MGYSSETQGAHRVCAFPCATNSCAAVRNADLRQGRFRWCGYCVLWLLCFVVLWLLCFVVIVFCGYCVLWLLCFEVIVFCVYCVLWLLCFAVCFTSQQHDSVSITEAIL